MAKVVVIGLPGEAGLWIADTESGTFKALSVPPGTPLAQANDLRGSGAVIVKNVDFALAVASAEDVFAGHFDA